MKESKIPQQKKTPKTIKSETVSKSQSLNQLATDRSSTNPSAPSIPESENKFADPRSMALLKSTLESQP